MPLFLMLSNLGAAYLPWLCTHTRKVSPAGLSTFHWARLAQCISHTKHSWAELAACQLRF